MKTTEFIKRQLAFTKDFATMLLADMKDCPMTQPTPKGGNHPVWALGHIVWGEANMLDTFILGKPNRCESWKGLFGVGTEPSTDAGAYPSLEELLAKFDEVRADLLAHLETLTDDDLDKRSHAPEDAPAFVQTVGGCYMATGPHVMFHSGQVADARRAGGRKPVMM